MPAEQSSDVKFEIGHVLFIDIVGYSKLLINEQSEQIQKLKQIVRGTEQFRLAEAEGKLLRLPTGDGGALVFRNSPEAPVLCALEISKELKKHPELRVRMGVHSGPVNEITDLNEQANIAGAGINIAQRVMDCGDAGHILVSKRVADDLEQYPQWRPQLHDLGGCEVKHGARLHAVNLYTDEVGNPQVPEKFKTASAAEKARPKSAIPKWASIGAAILIFIAIAFGGFLFWQRGKPKPSAPASSIPEKSIAVLPFENRSEEKGNAYFAEGIQDEILTRISKIADLKVISRTSTQHYKSAPENLPEIARQLGVAHILEGSVQKSGDAVRVNVQLIKAANDSHLWADTFDRKLTDIFSVESEVARAIADQLRAQLTGREEQVIAAKPTKNPQAYDLFLKAEYFSNQTYSASARNPAETSRQAADLYEKAYAEDPAFALAYARLAYLKARLYWYGTDPRVEAINAAQSAAARALALQPELPEAHLAKGYVHYWGHRDYDAALAEFAKAHEALPNNANVLTAIAVVHRRQGKMSETIHQVEQAAILDPRDNQLPRLIGETFVYMRRYAEADAPFHRTLVLFPDDLEAQVYRVTALQMRGELESASRLLAAIPADSDPQGWVSFARYQLALAMRQPDAALAALEHAPAWLLNSWPNSREPVTLLRGQALALKGEAGSAREAFLQAQQELEPLLTEPRQQADAESFLALVYAGLGQKSKALEAGHRATELLPPSKDVIVGGFYLAQLAAVEGQVGETESALNHIEQLLAMPAGHVVSTASLRFDPAWDPLRNDPRFQKLSEEKPK